MGGGTHDEGSSGRGEGSSGAVGGGTRDEGSSGTGEGEGSSGAVGGGTSGEGSSGTGARVDEGSSGAIGREISCVLDDDAKHEVRDLGIPLHSRLN